jgi:diguanylate cyclase (GGDEF)-like protein
VEVIRRSGEKAVAELRCIETTWQGEPGYLVSLRDVTQNVQLRHALQSLSITDDLTGLYNRRGFVLLAAQQCRMAIRAKREMLLIFADMDGLKTINDTLGHPQGDGAIKDVTTVLRRVFRQSDIIARIGGDEFAVLALEVDPNSVETIRRRLNDAIEAMNRPSERPYRISISIGIARFDPRSPCSVHDLLAKADQAMYAEKQRKHASAPSNSTR